MHAHLRCRAQRAWHGAIEPSTHGMAVGDCVQIQNI